MRCSRILSRRRQRHPIYDNDTYKCLETYNHHNYYKKMNKRIVYLTDSKVWLSYIRENTSSSKIWGTNTGKGILRSVSCGKESGFSHYHPASSSLDPLWSVTFSRSADCHFSVTQDVSQLTAKLISINCPWTPLVVHNHSITRGKRIYNRASWKCQVGSDIHRHFVKQWWQSWTWEWRCSRSSFL